MDMSLSFAAGASLLHRCSEWLASWRKAAVQAGARARGSATRKSRSDAATQIAPTQPRAETPLNARVAEPSAAPSENPRYMKEPLRERMIGAFFRPAMLIKRACCGGGKAPPGIPHTATPARTGGPPAAPAAQ